MTMNEYQQAVTSQGHSYLYDGPCSACGDLDGCWLWKVRPLSKPRIVCLCGSTRFYQEFQRANYEETMAGHIVLSVGFYMHKSAEAHGETWGCTQTQKLMLDELHKRKIDLCDEVLVLNVGGYIGDSTRSEIAYAEAIGKPVRWLEDGPREALAAVLTERSAKR